MNAISSKNTENNYMKNFHVTCPPYAKGVAVTPRYADRPILVRSKYGKIGFCEKTSSHRVQTKRWGEW
jgi:hypothetical protein